MHIGFIGLGNMGNPMCRNLLAAGFPLAVTDLRREAATNLLGLGAHWCESPSEVAATADILITMLPGPPQVEAVMLGQRGAFEAMRSGRTWIDMSTSIPAVARRVLERAAAREISVLEAPVSGMAKGATAGTLQIFVGGERDVFERCLPVLRAMGDPARIFFIGAHGTGYAVKLMINLLWFIHAVATSEVMVLGRKAGVDLEVLHRSLVASPANSNFLEHDLLSVFDGDYDEAFSLALVCKDLGLAIDLARDVGVPIELSALVEQIYRRARAQYGDRGGEMLAVKLLEDLTDTPLRKASAALA
jgi:3-hydroxyisobutyrate dehydrogenase